MMRSLFSGVSGLRNHQTRMDVIGNNIANVNTVGYKRSQVTFQDLFSQNLVGASSPQNGRGGSNPQQIGLGMTVASIGTVFTPGASETTGKDTNMMVAGDGLFIVGTGQNKYYTRAGDFDFDSQGNLVNPSGLLVQGWLADSTGAIDTTQPISSISVPKGQAVAPVATKNADFKNNLDSSAAIGTVVPLPVEVNDSLGNTYTINLQIKKIAANDWKVSIPVDGSGKLILPAGIDATNTSISSGDDITFNTDGSLKGPIIGGTTPTGNKVQLTVNYDSTVGSKGGQVITLDFDKLTQYNAESNVEMKTQDGNSSGALTGFSVDKSGVITGKFANGQTKALGQVALANFNNPAGLMKEGENLYTVSNNSGQPQIGAAGTGGRGTISPSTLEMSNVDLSQEFTDMIVTQRGFQANSRIITTSDEMLQELVNLKR